MKNKENDQVFVKHNYSVCIIYSVLFIEQILQLSGPENSHKKFHDF